MNKIYRLAIKGYTTNMIRISQKYSYHITRILHFLMLYRQRLPAFYFDLIFNETIHLKIRNLSYQGCIQGPFFKIVRVHSDLPYTCT